MCIFRIFIAIPEYVNNDFLICLDLADDLIEFIPLASAHTTPYVFHVRNYLCAKPLNLVDGSLNNALAHHIVSFCVECLEFEPDPQLLPFLLLLQLDFLYFALQAPHSPLNEPLLAQYLLIQV